MISSPNKTYIYDGAKLYVLFLRVFLIFISFFLILCQKIWCDACYLHRYRCTVTVTSTNDVFVFVLLGFLGIDRFSFSVRLLCFFFFPLSFFFRNFITSTVLSWAFLDVFFREDSCSYLPIITSTILGNSNKGHFDFLLLRHLRYIPALCRQPKIFRCGIKYDFFFFLIRIFIRFRISVFKIVISNYYCCIVSTSINCI